MRHTPIFYIFSILSLLFISCGKDDPARKTTFEMAINAPVTVKAGEIQTVYVYKDPGVTETVYANKITFTLPTNVSQVDVSRYDGTPAPTVDDPRLLYTEAGGVNNVSEEISHHKPFAMARKSQTFTFANGIGLKVNANEKFDIGTRVVNPTTSDITSIKSTVTFEAPTTTVTHEALPFIFYGLLVNMAPTSTGTYNYTFKATEKMNVVALTSFSSKYITSLKIFSVKGANTELVYTSEDWENPPVASFTTLVLNVNDGLELEVEYNNPTFHAVRFGMGMEDDFSGVFGYYYKD